MNFHITVNKSKFLIWKPKVIESQWKWRHFDASLVEIDQWMKKYIPNGVFNMKTKGLKASENDHILMQF